MEELQTVALLDVVGRLLEVRAEDWAAALNRAMANGWKPAGSTAPPRRWRPDEGWEPQAAWDGRYAEAAGQLVEAADAQEFGRALARAGHEKTAAIAEFCSRGSFLVCRMSAELKEPDERLRSGLEKLGERLGVAVEVGEGAHEVVNNQP